MDGLVVSSDVMRVRTTPLDTLDGNVMPKHVGAIVHN
jgi:hypothetical protein